LDTCEQLYQDIDEQMSVNSFKNRFPICNSERYRNLTTNYSFLMDIPDE